MSETQFTKIKNTPSENCLVRSVELEKLKIRRVSHFNNYWAVLTKRVRHKEYMSIHTYMYFLLILQIPLYAIMGLFDLVLTNNAAIILVIYVIFLFGIGMPIFMLFIFMGSYCRKGYMAFWHCIPLLRGIGVTIALLTITPEIIHISYAGLSMLYMSDMFETTIPWIDCNFEGATNTCLIANTIYEHGTNANCSRIQTFSALNYLRFNKLKLYEDIQSPPFGSVKMDWAIAVTISWILLLFVLIQDIFNFQKIMRRLQYICLICWIITYIGTLFNRGKFFKDARLFTGTHPLSNIEIWLYTLSHICNRNEPGSKIYLSSLKKTANLPPNINALIVFGYKLIIYSVLILWVPILLQNIFENYEILNTNCFLISGFEVLFAVVPDMLARLPLPQVWIFVWFLGLYIHCFCSCLYTCTSTVNSLIEVFPYLRVYRRYICCILCVICLAVGLPLLSSLNVIVVDSWIFYGYVIVNLTTLSIATCAIVFIYSITRLMDDYQFAYDMELDEFWVQSWKVSPFIITFLAGYMILYHIRQTNFGRSWATPVLISYTISILMLSPIFVVMFWKYSTHVKYQLKTSVIQPNTEWGYFNKSKRQARNHFNPQKEIRYKTNKLKCKHQCLINSRKLQKFQEEYNT